MKSGKGGVRPCPCCGYMPERLHVAVCPRCGEEIPGSMGCSGCGSCLSRAVGEEP